MSKSTIAKFCLFVIFSAVLGAFLTGCGAKGKAEEPRAENPNFASPRLTGKMQAKAIEESSGVAVSRCQDDVLWTHNDAGNGDFIYAVSSSGELRGVFRVRNTKNHDWEDIATYKDASGKCFLYIGEIGDNNEEVAIHEVYRFPEPFLTPDASRETKNALETVQPEVVRFRYPDRVQNAETLMVHPVSGEIYIATKREKGPSSVYKILPAFGASEPQTARKVGEISLPAVPNGLLTGGDISPDGRHAMLCDYTQGYELTLPDGAPFDEIWKQEPKPVDLGKRPHGEAVAYNAAGTAVLATSEKVNSPIYQIDRRP